MQSGSHLTFTRTLQRCCCFFFLTMISDRIVCLSREAVKHLIGFIITARLSCDDSKTFRYDVLPGS